MKYRIVFLVLLSFSCCIGQQYRITKILDTNLFELENNLKVRLYGLYIPSLNDSDNTLTMLSRIVLSNFAKDIILWENGFLLNRKLDFEFLNQNDDETTNVIAYISYAFSKANLASKFLSIGFATLLPNINQDFYSELIELQERAQKDNVGIWKVRRSLLEDYNSPIPITPELAADLNNYYEQPYIPLLAISAAAFVLAWDSFSSASDMQKIIDNLKSISASAKVKVDVPELESTQTRKTIIGITCLFAGVIITWFSLKEVEVHTNLQSLSLRYRF